MTRFRVPMVRKSTQYETAIIEVEADDEDAASEKAFNVAQGFQPDDDDSGFDYGAASEAVEWSTDEFSSDEEDLWVSDNKPIEEVTGA